MYNIDELKELICAVDNSGITNFTVKNADGEKIIIKKDVKVSHANPNVQTVRTTVTENVVEKNKKDEASTENYKTIKSPMVGVFYSSSAPDAKPFVEVGSIVSVGDTVCIVEAMKLMNEVTADINGEIVEVCVSNGDVVEYGQTLFKIK